jgi:uncharacterized protein (TIGR02271 family)
METYRSAVFVTQDGRWGRIAQEVQAGADTVQVTMDDGRQLIVPVDLLEPGDGGEVRVPLNLSQLEKYNNLKEGQVLVIPVIEEQLSVGKREVKTGSVRVTKKVSERQQLVDQPLITEEARVERIPVNEYIETTDPVAPWYDGNTLVIPVVEEVLVVEKKLVLREEIRITKYQQEVHRPQHVKLRKEEVVVEEEDNPLP